MKTAPAAAVVTPADVQTSAGWLFVSWHSCALMTLALPSTALPIGVDGLAMSSAICCCDFPARIDGSTDAPVAVALPP